MPLADAGIGLGSEISRPVTYAITAFLSIALYNVLELTFLLFVVFKRRRGLYFWTFLVATWGIAIYAVGFVLNDFRLADSIRLFNVTLIVLGWCAMVTGQSLVLYSRLHLIVRQRLVPRLVLGMIITNAILLHIPVMVLCYGANSVLYRKFTTPYGIYERIEVAVFFLQETTISGTYMYQMCRLLYTGTSTGGAITRTIRELRGEEAGRRLMLHLMYINAIVILLDIAILVLQFAGRYSAQTSAKAFIYSVKLKLEFNILNRLVEFAQRSRSRQDAENTSSSPLNVTEQQPSEDSTRSRHHRRKYSCPWAKPAEV
ncbi:hypothetical protein BDW62DRAFT_215867 [Aspergillus aurantiobrunneus]